MVFLAVSSWGIFLLTALQLRAQLLALDQVSLTGPTFKKKRRMQIRQPNERLRYLAFGSSSTFGVGLDSSSPENSYVSQIARAIDADLVNAASPIEGSALPAACTQTVVGDESVFDVISIEFSVFDQDLEILARRLRKRFPSALIVLIELWNPTMLRYRSYNNQSLEFTLWKEQHGFETVADATHGILKSGPERWFLAYPIGTRQRLDKTVLDIDAKTVTLSRPSKEVLAVADTAQDYLSWFQEDNLSVLSRSGHATLMQLIQSSVPDLHIWGRKPRVQMQLGSWGSGDHCHLWFSSGDFGDVDGGDSRQVDFGHVGSRHKHAIEFRRLRRDTVVVDNPFDTPRMLYLTYMTANEDGVYPKTKVRLNGAPTVQIDPFHDDENQLEKNFARTTAVGMILPNTSTAVRLDPLQRSALPFRLVGASLIAEEMKDVPIEFSLEPESVRQEKSPRYWSFW